DWVSLPPETDMAEVSTCPDIQQLTRLVLGALPPEEIQRLSQHLLACPSCVGMLHGFNADDTLIAHLRSQATRSAPSVKNAIDSLITHLMECSPRPGRDEDPEKTVARAALSDAPPSAESYDFLLAPDDPHDLGRLGSYRILQLLGHGGMGLVFKAEDVNLQRPVALKVLRPELAKDFAARMRFLREARAAAALKHDHIVTIYQVAQDNDVPYLAMEFLEGESLECRLERVDRLPLLEVLRIGREVAEALAAAHQRNLIHRDIKPANIWLEGPSHLSSSPPANQEVVATPGAAEERGRGEGGRVKILDFGLARPADESVHLTGT